MSVYEFDQAAAVAGVKLMVNSLPATGKKLVFEHLIHMLSGKDIGALSPQAQAALLALIPQAPQGDSMSAKSAGRSAECYSAEIAGRIRISIGTLIADAGGILLDDGDMLNKLPRDAAERLFTFLHSNHPLRGGIIAGHVILDTNNWVCIDRGDGGASDIVPGSLGMLAGPGLSGVEQDRIVAGISVNGVELRSPTDSRPVYETLRRATVNHEREWRPDGKLPFSGIWGRTADTALAHPNCRRLLGMPYCNEFGTYSMGSYDDCPSDEGGHIIGLLACWNIIKLLPVDPTVEMT